MSEASSSEAPCARPRVGVVIGSGGLKCAASIGLWRVLRRENIDVDLFVGCSGGSIYAARMALGFEPDEIERDAGELWDAGLPKRFHYPTLIRTLLPWFFRRRRRMGLLNDSPFLDAVGRAVRHSTFEQLKTPLFIMATDLETGERVPISEGSITEAVRASSAIPIWFRPWVIGGRLLVDGGVADPMPVSVAIREGCDIIIAMGFEQPRYDQLGTLLGAAGQVTSISMNNLLRATFAFYNVAHHAEIIPIIPEFDRRIGLGDTHLIHYIVERGERAAEAEVPYLRRLLAARTAAVPAAGETR